MKGAILIISALGLAGCASVGPAYAPPAPPPPFAWASGTATIGFGGQVMINGLGIRPIAVVEDSRCAINVRCVWAGRLVLAVEVSQPGTAPLRTNMTMGQPLATAGGTLTLIDAAPPKIAGAGSAPATQFTFEMKR